MTHPGLVTSAGETCQTTKLTGNPPCFPVRYITRATGITVLCVRLQNSTVLTSFSSRAHRVERNENFKLWDRLLFLWDRQVPMVGGYNLSAHSARPVPIQRAARDRSQARAGRRHTTHRPYTDLRPHTRASTPKGAQQSQVWGKGKHASHAHAQMRGMARRSGHRHSLPPRLLLRRTTAIR